MGFLVVIKIGLILFNTLIITIRFGRNPWIGGVDICKAFEAKKIIFNRKILIFTGLLNKYHPQAFNPSQ